MGRLDGKVAVITGAARGMGASEARLFVAEGAKVVLADKREEGADLAAELGSQAIFMATDVTNEESWAALVDAAVSSFGGLDVLINNAGIIRVVPLEDCTLDVFNHVLATNLTSAFLGMRAALGPMKAGKGGSIINVSSPQGLEGRYGMPAYTASKFAVRGLTKTVAIELGQYGIRVNTIIPGPIKTAMTRRPGWTDEQYDRAYNRYPLARMGNPEEVANLALFLASDESSYCTGADFIADGGVTAGKPRD